NTLAAKVELMYNLKQFQRDLSKIDYTVVDNPEYKWITTGENPDHNIADVYFKYGKNTISTECTAFTDFKRMDLVRETLKNSPNRNSDGQQFVAKLDHKLVIEKKYYCFGDERLPKQSM
ncbi:hypothetical protein BDF19DRAFT_447628, partial [Syncephalis fuscata]